MARYGKEIGLLWTLFVSYLLINAADERGRRILLDQRVNLFTSSNNNFGGGIGGTSGFSDLLLHGNVLLDGNFLGCKSYAEYNDLVHFQNDMLCHSVDTVFAKLRALHERSHSYGPGCMQDVIGKLNTYFSAHHDNFKGCKCTGNFFYHPERYNVMRTCKNRNSYFDDLYARLFGNDSIHGHCIPYDRVLSLLGSLPTHLDFFLDCQWEIINHYTTIIDANGTGCSCFHELKDAHTTPNHLDSVSAIMSIQTSENKPTTDHTPPPPTHSKSTTMSLTKSENKPMTDHTPPHAAHSTSTTMSLTPTLTVPHTCTKAATISTLGYGIKQANNAVGNCHPETSDHMAPEALVINMCNVTGHSESWTRGQNVMSVCERIPLYTPVATFFDGKYSNQGGLSGIFVGCLLNGFKLIVQECDKNITVMHVVAGGHFQLDPLNYSIIM